MENLSAPLYALMNNGHMKESQTKNATLEDVEVSTFIAFCEFDYTGQYVTPTIKGDLTVVESSNIKPQCKGLFNEDLRDLYSQNTSNGTIPRPQNISIFNELWEKFVSRRFGGTFATLSAVPDILVHAKTYVFATKYLIEPLRQQSLGSLHRDLCAYSLTIESSRLIFDILDFVYNNTGRMEPDGESSLRELLMHYVASKLLILSRNKDFLLS